MRASVVFTVCCCLLAIGLAQLASADPYQTRYVIRKDNCSVDATSNAEYFVAGECISVMEYESYIYLMIDADNVTQCYYNVSGCVGEPQFCESYASDECDFNTGETVSFSWDVEAPQARVMSINVFDDFICNHSVGYTPTYFPDNTCSYFGIAKVFLGELMAELCFWNESSGCTGPAVECVVLLQNQCTNFTSEELGVYVSYSIVAQWDVANPLLPMNLGGPHSETNKNVVNKSPKSRIVKH